MVKEKRPLNPTEAWRKSQKRRDQKTRRHARLEADKTVPIEARDPHELLNQLQRYQHIDQQGRLDAIGRTKLKHTIDKIRSLSKARVLAGLDPIEIPEPSDAPKLAKTENHHISQIIDKARQEYYSQLEAANEDDSNQSLPPMPTSPCPYTDGVPGLPNYCPPLVEDDGLDLDTVAAPQIIISAEPQLPTPPPHSRSLRQFQKHRPSQPRTKTAINTNKDEIDAGIDRLLNEL